MTLLACMLRLSMRAETSEGDHSSDTPLLREQHEESDHLPVFGGGRGTSLMQRRHLWHRRHQKNGAATRGRGLTGVFLAFRVYFTAWRTHTMER